MEMNKHIIQCAVTAMCSIKLITVMVSDSQSRTVDNDLSAYYRDGRWGNFVLEFPHLQRENSLDLKKLQTIFACLWFETATP